MLPTKKSRMFPSWLVLMAGLASLGPLAVDMYLPAFPDIATSLNTSFGQVERTLASYLLGLALAQLLYGPLADRYGRKLTILGGLIIFCLASICSIFTTDIAYLSFWRVIQALGGAAGMVIPRTVIRDRLETREAAKALSLLMLITGLMPILSPIIGGQLLLFWSWRGLFALMAAFAFILCLLVYYTMEETLVPEKVIALKASIIAKNYLELLRHRQFMCHSLAGGFGLAGLFTYLSGSPRVFMGLYDIEPHNFGFYFGLNAASYVTAAQFSARLLDRLPPERLLFLSQTTVIITSLVGVVLTLANALPLPALLIFLMAFMGAQGFINPNAAALALGQQGRRLGVASALMGTVQMLCGAGAGMLISAWHTSSALSLTGMLFVCALLSWLFGWLARP